MSAQPLASEEAGIEQETSYSFLVLLYRGKKCKTRQGLGPWLLSFSIQNT